MLVRVAPSFNIYEPLTYRYTGDPGDIFPGRRVIIPLGRQVTSGWVLDEHSGYQGRVKKIIGLVRDGYRVASPFLDFARAVADIYFLSPGMILDASLSPGKKPIKKLQFYPPGDPDKAAKLDRFSQAQLQELAGERPLSFFYKDGTGDKEPVEMKPPAPVVDACGHRFLVGFDRLERYREIIASCLEQDRSVLIVVPDNLTAEYLARHLEGIDMYNSGIKARERDRLWLEYGTGKCGVLAGGQSAVFLPMANLGAIICERSGTGLYQGGRYSQFNVRLLAQWRAKTGGLPFIEGFAGHTPMSFGSGESLEVEDNRAEPGRPAVDVHMLTRKDRGVPDALIELIKAYFLENKKILIILNKKETTRFLYCEECKKVTKCPLCTGTVKIKKDAGARCLSCSFEPRVFDRCPACGGDLIEIEDIGFSSLEKRIKKDILETGVFTLAAADIQDADDIARQLEAGKIVIATPVVVNPFFKGIFDALVYVRPESLFNLDEYHAAEKIFSLVSELRELVKTGGTIDVFSTFHFHYALKHVNDEQAFFERELKYRQWFQLPPYASVYRVEVKAGDLRSLGKEMRAVYGKYKESLGIRKIFLASRQKSRGNYKGVIEAHTSPGALQDSGLVNRRHMTIVPVMI